MLVELVVSWVDIAPFIVSILTLIGLMVYSYFTYLIAKDTQEVFVSFDLQQTIKTNPNISPSHISFGVVNRTKFEVEVFGKVWAEVNNQKFEFKTGFYGDDTNMLVQPFASGGGGFDLKNLENEQNDNLDNFSKNNDVNSINIFIQLKYRKVGTKKFRITSAQPYRYEFKTHKFWWAV